jgi:hypothetical protein
MSNDSQGSGPKPFGGTAIMPSIPQQQGPSPPVQQPYGQPPPQQGAYGQAPQQGSYGQAPQQGSYGQPPPAGGYGYPQAQQAQQAYPSPTQDQYAQAYGPQPGYAQQPQQPQQAYGQYAQPYAPPAYAPGGVGALPCPRCNQMTTSMKSYTMVQFLLFIWFFAFWRRQTVTCCPSCMRNELMMKTLINLVPANLLWLFLVLPWNTVLFCMTFADGHSSKVRFAMR